MKSEITINQYNAVGPYPNVYGHGPVTIVAADVEDGLDVAFCLDCGYTHSDIRMFLHADCVEPENINRKSRLELEVNHINQTWREYLSDNDGLPTGIDDE